MADSPAQTSQPTPGHEEYEARLKTEMKFFSTPGWSKRILDTVAPPAGPR